MPDTRVFDLIVEHTREVIPELEGHRFAPSDSLRDLGANSIDRAEIIVMTLESLSMSIPLVELADAKNMGELADLIHDKSAV
ncbi:acyl carrier protein [Streptomyces fungicidicus]|uniref:Acyl carrier protein n=2 Tax=Streptomyces TaxID=1883 RepID=A0A494UTK2_9ACTN|nr:MULTISPECIES: acyl carrier protein [Streptomyces]AYL34009.1 acyl carrier protein [Streptomyces fungicidicus]EFL43499.1 acyl carrier protein AcpK [Streptomyces griseoflavus Tu4000]QKW04468.1 acyl carrier protein [Streptomyces sp. NA02536]TQL24779.1 polyketide biosynthesis acyl carrier protein [Streptomyces sp. SLBN-134]